MISMNFMNIYPDDVLDFNDISLYSHHHNAELQAQVQPHGSGRRSDSVSCNLNAFIFTIQQFLKFLA